MYFHPYPIFLSCLQESLHLYLQPVNHDCSNNLLSPSNFRDMKNIDETTLQKIPCLILTDLIVKLTSLSINLHNKSL